MVFTELIAVVKHYAVYALRTSYKEKDGFLRKRLLPVLVVIQKLECSDRITPLDVAFE